MTLNSRIQKKMMKDTLEEHNGPPRGREEESSKQVEVISRAIVFQKSIFRVEEIHLRHERCNGSMTHEFVRLNLDRGDSVAAILHDKTRDLVILVEQFRYSTYEKGPGWIIELPAGIIDTERDETPETTLRREIMEESGYLVQDIHHISTFYASPGGSSERIYLYYASVTQKDQIADGGGLIDEGEDIRTFLLPVDDALAKIATGKIVDAKTIIALQWLQNRRSFS